MRNLNGFWISKRNQGGPMKVDVTDIKFNLNYRDRDGNQIKGFRRCDVRRIILETGYEVSHPWASKNLTYLGKDTCMNHDENLAKPTGGSNRNWTNAYRALIAKSETYKNIPKELRDEKMEWFIKGYEEAVKTFTEITNSR